MTRPTVLLWDIDGTLVTTGGVGRRAVERAFDQQHGRADACALIRFDGMTDRSIVRLGLEEPIQFASGQPAVLRRIAALLREVAWCAPRGRVDAELLDQLDRVVRLAAESTSVDRAETDRWRQQVADAMAGRWDPVVREARPVQG